MKQFQLEELREEQLPQVLKIYNHYILNSTATFHLHPMTITEMREVVFFDKPKYKTFVIIADQTLCGYVLIMQHKKREAYDATAEVSIYIKPEFTGQGLGSPAIQYIEGVAKKSGIHVLVATITGDNETSIRLFEKNGYFKCAHYKEVGMKFGKLLDVVAYQKIISN
jgi:phosphinothricin acetyltransferase